MSRLSRMNELINKLSDEKFSFGRNDCYSFTSKLVKEWHGRDYIKLHAVYKNEKEAKAYMDKHGGIEKLTTGTLGYSIAPEKCIDGDVVSLEVKPGEIAIGFVFDDCGYFKCRNKPIKVSLGKCRIGWRIK